MLWIIKNVVRYVSELYETPAQTSPFKLRRVKNCFVVCLKPYTRASKCNTTFWNRIRYLYKMSFWNSILKSPLLDLIYSVFPQ